MGRRESWSFPVKQGKMAKRGDVVLTRGLSLTLQAFNVACVIFVGKGRNLRAFRTFIHYSDYLPGAELRFINDFLFGFVNVWYSKACVFGSAAREL